MERLVTSNLRLGIIAGGQLGKMLIQDASKWDIITYALDPVENCPAGNIASYFTKGSHLDYNTVYRFGRQVDVLTYEIESININALHRLKQEGVKVVPDPAVLEMIQDKGLQKNFYHENGKVRLQPANPLMQPIIIDNPEQVKVQGKVVLVIRRMENA